MWSFLSIEMRLQAHPSPASPKGYDDDFLRQKTGTGNYYARKHPVTGKPYHAAIDLPPSVRGRDGDPICAAWDGTIRLRSFGPAYGRQVTVVADDGYGAFMAHLSAIYVSEGQRVKAGQHIADMGNTGSQSVGTHGHFEKRRKWDDWNSVENPYQELRALEAGNPGGGGDDELASSDEIMGAALAAKAAADAALDQATYIRNNQIPNLDKEVAEIKAKLSTSTPSGGGNSASLTDADLARIAKAVADENARRQQS